MDFPGKNGERFTVYAASTSKPHGPLSPMMEYRLMGS